MINYTTALLMLILLSSCHKEPLFYVNVAVLSDNDPSTVFIGQEGYNRILFKDSFSTPILSYTISSSGEKPLSDPCDWTLKGSYDGKTWIDLDKREGQFFCSRYQEIQCNVSNPSNYCQYLLEATTATGDTLKIGDVQFYQHHISAGWEEFSFPEVDFEICDNGAGAIYYTTLVQDPEAYIRYHARKVATLLYSSVTDSIPTVEKINYKVFDFDGISRKTGQPPIVSIDYDSGYIAQIGNQSLYALDQETRGVLYHILTYAYQYEPKGIGTYATNAEFRACVEGLAFAVRAQTGCFEMNKRKSGGHWLDGLEVTGFFLHWLTSKNPDTVRLFNRTIKELEPWSFDSAMKYIFGPDASIEKLWAEYQMDINKQQLKELI